MLVGLLIRKCVIVLIGFCVVDSLMCGSVCLVNVLRCLSDSVRWLLCLDDVSVWILLMMIECMFDSIW